MSDLPIHPLCELTRDYTPEEFVRLKGRIERTGRINPIKLFKGEVVAGRHRLRAVKELGWKNFPTKHLPDDLTELELRLEITGDDDVRRNDDRGARFIYLAKVYLDLVERREQSDGRPTLSVAIATLNVSDVAKLEEVHRGELNQAFQVIWREFPGLAELVEYGRATLREAAAAAGEDDAILEAAVQMMGEDEKLKLPSALTRAKRESDAADREEAAAKWEGDRWAIHHCGIQDLSSLVEAESVDLIFCDPPYEEDGLNLFFHLSDFASYALKPGGSLLVMTGWMYLPDVMERLIIGEGINYQWMITYQMGEGPASQVYPRNIFQVAKGVVWLVKGSYDGPYIRDLVEHPKMEEGDEAGRFHKWGQTVAGAELVLRPFLDKNQGGHYSSGLVCDPMVGAGAFGVAALKVGAGRFVGADIDGGYAAAASERLTEGQAEGQWK